MKGEEDTVEKEDMEWMLGSNMIISYLHRRMRTQGVLICLLFVSNDIILEALV